MVPGVLRRDPSFCTVAFAHRFCNVYIYLAKKASLGAASLGLRSMDIFTFFFFSKDTTYTRCLGATHGMWVDIISCDDEGTAISFFSSFLGSKKRLLKQAGELHHDIITN